MANKYNYKGTKITGTSTSAKVFSKSGISNAKKNQTYFNTSTGHVYTCDTAGTASQAKWKYTRTDIAKKPTVQVKSLGAPVRTTSGSNTYMMTTQWKVPGSLTNQKMGDRAESLTIDWWLGTPSKNDKDPKCVRANIGTGATQSTINLKNFIVGSKTYNRASFYPFAGKPKMTYVTVGVRAENSKGYGKELKETRKFVIPKAPTLSAWTFDTDHGEASITITTDAGTGYAERYDTKYKMTVTDTHTGETFVHSDSSSTSTSIVLTYDASDYQELAYDEYIEVKVEAYARGYAGDSSTVTSTYYIAYPAKATIGDIEIDGVTSADKCTVKIKTNHSKTHPVDQVRLGYLANTTYAFASEIPGGADWTWSDIVDDSACTALAIPVGDLLPERGKHTWICVKSFHANEEVLFRYSDFKEVTQIFTPAATAADDDIVILEAHAGSNGESAVVLLGWNADGEDDSTGTELTWSDEEDTWKSTKAPDEHEFTWSDGPLTYNEVTYQDSAEIVIKGLEEGTKYYIRARRYLEDDVTSYSPYSNTATVLTSERPETIVATCDSYVPTGSSLQVNWTFAGNGLQTKWQIVKKVSEVAEGETVWTDDVVIAEGEGSTGSTQISAERLAAFATGNSVTFSVQASTGSGFIPSENHTVTILDAPTLSINTTSPLVAQSLTAFTATSSRLCDLVTIVTSQGASGQTPRGFERQTAGDTIHSDVYSPVWTELNGVLSATVQLPEGLDFWDGGSYMLTVTAIDRETGLKSETQTAEFTVAWSHQAPDPFDYITITPLDYTDDESDAHHQAVQIDLTPPENSESTDVYDIYRMSGDGAQLIGEGFPMTYTAVDEYAPFGDDLTLSYRIALRTVDGDVEFADVEYNLDGTAMRFDWAGGSLELPYNLSIADSYKKDVEVRKHMNGTQDGYWNQGVERAGSLSSDVIRLTQQDKIEAARALARYTGPVFVRTPDGSAYEADVQVSDLSTEGVITAIAIDATEIGLTSEFELPIPFELEEEETE